MRSILCIIAIALLATALWAVPSYRIIADIPGDAAYADSVITVTAARLSNLIGPSATDSIDVFIVSSNARFDSLTGPSIPDWGAGVAMPHKNRIVVKSPLILTGEKSLGELVAHEFSHIALSRAVRSQPVPRWLNEGMAMYSSAEWGWGDNLAMGWAVISGNIIPLSKIEQLNRFQSGQAQVAYSESYLAFRYFLDTYGRSGLRILLAGLAEGHSIDDAFVSATGTDQAGFGREFSIYLHGRYNVITMIFNSNILWILLALLIVVGFVLYLFRRKKRFAEFDEYDKYHSTDFDYGEVEEPDEDKPWD
jgi:hypothetical protein